MKLFGSADNKITKDKNGEDVPHFQIKWIVLVHCNIVNNDYQKDSRVLASRVKSPFGSLLETSPTNVIPLKTLTQNFKPLKCGLQIKKVNY